MKKLALFIFAYALWVPCYHAYSQPLYTLTALGDLPGGPFSSSAHNINNHGQVVGVSSITGSDKHAFIWDSGEMTDLGDIPSGPNISSALGINDLGQVCGLSSTSNGPHFFIWESGTMTDLGLGIGMAINNNSQIVGGTSAFRWDATNGKINIADLPGGSPQSVAFAINDLGQITGSLGFLYDPIDGISTFAPNIGKAYDINNHGQITGNKTNDRAFFWDPNDGLTNLGVLIESPSSTSIAYSLNIHGQVVGRSTISVINNTAFLWDATHGMRDLNDLVDDSGNGWTLEVARGINDNGWIAGYGTNPSGHNEAFLLKPIIDSFDYNNDNIINMIDFAILINTTPESFEIFSQFWLSTLN